MRNGRRGVQSPSKLAINDGAAALRAGSAGRPGRHPPRGLRIAGPTVILERSPTGPRQDRRWASAWSPEQIAHRLQLDFPDDEEMRISHEAIYQSLYVQGRGALRRELTACLRTGRALRVPRARSRGRGQVLYRAGDHDQRATGGSGRSGGAGSLGGGSHPRVWDSSAIGTLVERTTRFTMLLHLPRMAEHGVALA